ncbi:MAG: Nif3-like dinuclear metal center hexameric protein, partial [Deltaproteobacteria bacterium]
GALAGATTGDILDLVERLAPPSLAEEWDRCGLQIGERRSPVSKLLIALSPTLRAAEEAVKRKADLLLTHHPLLLAPIQALDFSKTTAKIIGTLVRGGVGHICAHTNLDKADGGVNDCLAAQLGLVDVEPLGPGEPLKKIVVTIPSDHFEVVRVALKEAGAGSIGPYKGCSFAVFGDGYFTPLEGSDAFIGEVGREASVKEVRLEAVVTLSRLDGAMRALISAHPYERPAVDVYELLNRDERGAMGRVGSLKEAASLASLAADVKRRIKAPGVRYVGDGAKTIKRVAVCGGSGGDLWREALRSGADALVTGDLKYHTALDAVEEGFALIDAGHHSTEASVLEPLAKFLAAESAKIGADLEVDVFFEQDPFEFI